ncbi:TPA: F0F1 ATP synthase subunit epsilon, partial [Mannheimia haemolytica]|nr:F0F1 ATP synthase subunit epsilon [Mannheimia haemolytica]
TLSKTSDADMTAKLAREIAKLRVYELTKTKLANKR